MLFKSLFYHLSFGAYAVAGALFAPAMLKLSLLFVAFGCLAEVMFTATYDSYVAGTYKPYGWQKKVQESMGYWSTHYLWVYGIIIPLCWTFVAVPYLYGLHWLLRTLLMGALIQLGEVACMYGLRKFFGRSPSESAYHGKPDSIKDLTRVMYYPVFCLLGVYLMWIHRMFM